MFVASYEAAVVFFITTQAAVPVLISKPVSYVSAYSLLPEGGAAASYLPVSAFVDVFEALRLERLAVIVNWGAVILRIRFYIRLSFSTEGLAFGSV